MNIIDFSLKRGAVNHNLKIQKDTKQGSTVSVLVLFD
jgi:hypothetical protein